MAEHGADDENERPGPDGPVASSGPISVSASALEDLPATLLCAGYHLRFLNAWRRQFEGRAEFAVVPLIHWLCDRLSSDVPHVASAASAALQSIGLRQPPTRGCYSLRELESVTGIRRETLRRTEHALETQGWLSPEADGVRVGSARLSEWLESPAKHERLRDFRWTADCLRELRLRPAGSDGVTVADALGAIRACRTDELPAALQRPLVEMPAQVRSAALVQMQGYNLRHFLQVAGHFSGDFVQAILLGEIGHRNVAAVTRSAEPRDADLPMGLQQSLPGESAEANRRRASNAYSLALALDIPYETIRRKLTQLCRAGRLMRDANGLYWVRPEVADEFLEFNRARRADMLATAATIDGLLESR